MCLLQHDTHALAQRALRDVGDGDAVVEDAPALNLVETVDQVDDRGLACSCATYEGDLLSGIGVDVDVEEHLLRTGVAEIHILEVYVALGILQHDLAIVCLRLLIHQIEYALCTHRGIQHAVDLLAYL